jgi:hypothetical protein
VLLDQSTVRLGTASRASVAPPSSSRRARLRRGGAAWAGRYSRALTGFEVVAAAVAAGTVLGAHPQASSTSTLFWASLGLVAVWPVLLHATGAHAERVFGTGSDEYRAVGTAGFALLAVAGFVSYAAGLDLSRALVVVAVPALTLVTLLGRFAARCVLRGLRAQGRCTKRVVVVGRGTAALELVDRLRREHFAGLEVVRGDASPRTTATGWPAPPASPSAGWTTSCGSPAASARTPSPSPPPARPPRTTCARCPGSWRAPGSSCSSRRASSRSPAPGCTSARSRGCRCCRWSSPASRAGSGW